MTDKEGFPFLYGASEMKNLQIMGFGAYFLRVANLVNNTGKEALHQELWSEDEAHGCLQSAREVLQLLLCR